MSEFVRRSLENKQKVSQLLSPTSDYKPFEEFSYETEKVQGEPASYGYAFGDVESLTVDEPNQNDVHELHIVFLTVSTYHVKENHANEEDDCMNQSKVKSFVQVLLQRDIGDMVGLPSIVYDQVWKDSVKRIANAARISAMNRIGFAKADNLTYVVYQVEQDYTSFNRPASPFSCFVMVTPYEIAYGKSLSFSIQDNVCRFIQANPGFFRLYCDGELMPGVSVGYIGGSVKYIEDVIHCLCGEGSKTNQTTSTTTIEVSDVNMAIIKSIYEINDISRGYNRLTDIKTMGGSVLRVIMKYDAWQSFGTVDLSVTQKQKAVDRKTFQICERSFDEIYAFSQHDVTVPDISHTDLFSVLYSQPNSFFLF